MIIIVVIKGKQVFPFIDLIYHTKILLLNILNKKFSNTKQ
jgi:hypothetical protein